MCADCLSMSQVPFLHHMQAVYKQTQLSQINNYKQTTNSTVCVDNSLQYSCNSAVTATQVRLESILSIKRANWEVQHLKVEHVLNLLFRFDDVTRLRVQVKQ